jgi:queuine tRNA-ribosyltransferase
MPVGTRATVKGLWPDQLREAGSQMILANTYHLALRPGADVVADLGGLHRMMGWNGPILTDSGGFQVFSLAELRTLDDDRVVFKSHVDGSLLDLTPASAIHIQEQLGADCIMCLDECPAHDVSPERLTAAVDRTTRWAALCRDAQRREDQALFGILQGGIDPRERERSAQGLLPLDFPGYAIGGLSVGERPELMYSTLDFTVPMLPEDRPRYLMGVGRPIDLIEGVLRGVDLFDCVMPTRNARNATAFTSIGPVKMRNLKHQRDQSPLDPNCDCATCRQFSRGYLRHLFLSDEMLGPMLLSLHNITYYQRLMRDLRQAIWEGRGTEFRSAHLAACVDAT